MPQTDVLLPPAWAPLRGRHPVSASCVPSALYPVSATWSFNKQVLVCVPTCPVRKEVTGSCSHAWQLATLARGPPKLALCWVSDAASPCGFLSRGGRVGESLGVLEGEGCLWGVEPTGNKKARGGTPGTRAHCRSLGHLPLAA